VVRSVGSVRCYAGVEQDPVRALLRASDGAAAWSDSFDERFTGVFDMQDLISAIVSTWIGSSS
jgi:TolB-like protein